MEKQGCLVVRGPGVVGNVNSVILETLFALEHPDILDEFANLRAAYLIENIDLAVTCFTFIPDLT